MSGPWEKYQAQAPLPSGPWEKYASARQPQAGMLDRLDSATSALTIPEKMSREGWQAVQDNIPQGTQSPTNIPGLGMIDAKQAVGAIKNVAPDFISRESILTGGAVGAAKMAVKGAKMLRPIGRAIARTAESASGLEYNTPGILTQAFNDRRLITGRGTSEAGGLYDELMEKGRIRKEFSRLKDKQLIDEGGKYLDDGTMTPEEALLSRRALDRQKKSYSTNYKRMRGEYDELAKTKSAEADAAYSRAIRSDALRQPLPVNKRGGTSVFKATLGTVSGLAPLVAMSPFAQGTAATAAGMGYRAAGRILKPIAKVSMGAASGTGAAINGGKSLAAPKEEKILTPEGAKDYLKRAKGDRSAARRLAVADGWTIPE